MVRSKTVYYANLSATGKNSKIFRKTADGSRDAEELVSLDQRFYLMDVTRDGKTAYIDYIAQRSDVSTIALEPSAKPKPVVATPFGEAGASLSPNERFVAYYSNESGRGEGYVRDLSPSGGRWQISTTGGEEPNWSPDGHELYFRANDLLMVASVDTTSAFTASPPRILLKGIYNLRSDTLLSFAVDPKAPRFLMIRPAIDNNATAPIRVVLGWFSELKSKFESR